jgi:maltose/maltodextrin transport system substrate-binding protein
MFAPAFDFAKVEKAAAYRFTIECADGASRTFEARQPWAPLTPVWKEIPSGTTSVRVDALDRPGGSVVAAGIATRQFHRASAFNGPYATAVLPYDQSARVALATVTSEPYVQSWLTTGRRDPRYPLYRYAAKVIGRLLTGCALHAGQSPRPADADDALAIGRRAADFLMSVSGAAGTPLEHFPPTYYGAKPTERENDNWSMLMTPAEAAQGYLDLYDATRDERYLAAARRVADTYRKLQLPTGTWHLKVDNRTGEPIAAIELIPSAVINFLDRLEDQYGINDYRPTLKRAVEWTMNGPVKTFNWQAQFDDAKVRGAYQNLSKHEACEFACYLFRRMRDEPEKVAIALELLRFAEDQFVTWEHPPAPEIAGIQQQRSQPLHPGNWFTPCSLEQYGMFEPISGSSAFMIVAYLDAHEATRDPLHLAKAQSLANALTVAQRHHQGKYPTRMIRRDLSYWVNSTINSARAMKLLSERTR